jgi:cell wall-associated NlpC family hydrolase
MFLSVIEVSLGSTEQFIKQSGFGIAETARALGQEVFSKPYKWGGKTKDGFDCSGFVAHVFSEMFPHHRGQFQTNVDGFIKSNLFETVEAPQPGDIIVFKAHLGAVNHIGIVISDKLWIGAQSKGIREVQLNNPYWSSRPHYFRRYKSGSPQAIQTSFLYYANARHA